MLLLLAMLMPSGARASDAFTIAQPAGFDAVAAEQEQIVDIYYDDNLRGQATALVSPGTLRFVDPDAVLALLPDVADRAAVRMRLGAPALPTNAALLCERPDNAVSGCGRLPESATGIIYDSRRFRVDVFVAQPLRSVTGAISARYFTPSATGLSAVYRIAGTVSGSGGKTDLTVQNRIIVARRNARLRAEFTYADRVGFLSDTLTGEIDAGRLRYQAGVMWAPGSDLLGQRKLLGIGVTTQVDTRADRDVLTGTPLIVSLFQRAQVDIFRDDRLLSSQIYEAGNRALDTGSLPDGSYAVVLRIHEAGGATREVRRFFSKGALLPAASERFYFAYAGMLAGDRAGRFLRISDRGFANAGIAQRLSPNLVVDAKVAVTSRAGVAELGGLVLQPWGQARLSGLLSTRGDRGLIAQANTNGAGRWNVAFDLRRMWATRGTPVLPYGNDMFQDGSLARYEQFIRPPPSSYTQAGAQLSYQMGFGQVGLIGTYRRFDRARSFYAIGPTAYIPLIERGGVQVAFRGEWSFDRRGHNGFAGISLLRTGPGLSVSAAAGVRNVRGDTVRDGTNAVVNAGVAWQGDDVLGGTLGLSANVDHDRFGTGVAGRADLRTAPIAIAAQGVGSLGRGQTAQYSANFATALAVTGGRIGFDGRNMNDSALVVAVKGPAGATKFTVLVNGTPRGVISGGQHLTIAVPAYRQYAVRLQAVGGSMLRLDGRPRAITTFPGTVVPLDWTVYPVAALFGRLVWPDGTPVAGASLTTADGIGETDNAGFFQLESGVDALVTARADNDRTCSVQLAARPVDGYADVGTLTCVKALPALRIAGSLP